MRLLHTKSLKFEEFFDSNIPEYVILSHRWGAKETSFQEFQKSKKKSGAGFSKIRKFCSLAKAKGFEWVWIDTCCIDKKSSAELSEAINSMYRWYENAVTCYAYLSDVVWESGDVLRSLARFRQSVWFTRGWTLQELLAPSTIIFLDSKWELIGDKDDLLNDISAMTGITPYNLNHPNQASVAMKMSWASRRKTSRIEDVAYCLMGIFDINMPLLYGEGRKAFRRLQLEIIKASSDESIFAWETPFPFCQLLAPQPSSFAKSGDIIRREFSARLPYLMTNKGLQFHVPCSAIKQGTITLPLNCRKSHSGTMRRIVITLKRDDSRYGSRSGSHWFRVNAEELLYVDHREIDDAWKEGNTEVIYIQTKMLHSIE